VNDCCLMPNEQFFNYISDIARCISMRWRRLFCTRPTSSKQSVGIYFTPLLTHYPDYKPISLCSCPLMSHAMWQNSKYQFHCLVWHNVGTHSRSIALEVTMLTITPSMRFSMEIKYTQMTSDDKSSHDLSN